MATRAAKKASGAGKASKTGARRTATGATVRTARTRNGVSGDKQPEKGKTSEQPQNEPELSRLEREKENALATGAIQPPPDQAARIGKTATIEPPPGRAHVAPNDDEALPAPRAGDIRVRATRIGYYDHVRRRIGDVFDLKARPGLVDEPILDPETEEPKEDRDGRILTRRVKRLIPAEMQFSDRWMERVDPATPKKTTTSGEVIKARHDELVTARFGHKATGDRDVI